MAYILLGAAFMFAGLVFMAGAAIWRGQLSGPGSSRSRLPTDTLEPAQRGVRFLGLQVNWPGIALFVLGAILLLIGAFD
ncbi:hypothetical protein KEU06_01245 [Pseudaminobacter sp. 19-2017]|uniref:Uncharacterized protein n=1 Tax=Pseudaminobacter soli (ex Zhang et al. 2022) TaxID=2831468 RepID=A0A942DV98_9HYPH|nr:hypothetical protein [Pseudaminobacter soli]MBS3647251.1 hypothetical protein [Pseudaminobacter soli]